MHFNSDIHQYNLVFTCFLIELKKLKEVYIPFLYYYFFSVWGHSYVWEPNYYTLTTLILIFFFFTMHFYNNDIFHDICIKIILFNHLSNYLEILFNFCVNHWPCLIILLLQIPLPYNNEDNKCNSSSFQLFYFHMDCCINSSNLISSFSTITIYIYDSSIRTQNL